MHNLPTQLTLFVGRTEEINEINHLLANPDCRLLTVVGVGGIGKTRLALQAASQMADTFADGVHFVALQPITSIQLFISTVADAINFPLSGSEEPQAQLLYHLRHKELLLILDNFEHLLEGVYLLTAILEAASKVKLLVTSREILHLQEEWLYPIQGLDFPQSTADLLAKTGANIASYSAVQLFVERARRVRRGFSLEAELEDVVTICQMVEGMPLALELAAVWTQTLSCRAIADEIQRDLDFLTSEWRNVPDRQRSMRAVFDHSCHLLTPTEQEVFKRLSVFRGGFRREAAECVAGASLSLLGALVSRSLLRWDTVGRNAAGRYQIHELLRQYAEELLCVSTQEKAEVDDRHCVYYTNFLYERFPNLLGGRQLEALIDIEAERENIRVAWRYAVEMGKIEEIGRAVQALAEFYQFRSRHLEGSKVFEEAIEKLALFEASAPREMLVAIRFQELAWFYIRLGRFEEAQTIQEKFQALYERLEIPPIPGPATDPALVFSILATIRGDYQTAVRFGTEALQQTEIHPHLLNRQYAYYTLAGATLAQGQYHVAQQYAEAAYTTSQETQDRWFMAYCLIEMGNAACAMRDYAAARAHWEASYAIRKEFNDPEGMAVALNYLGEVALHQEQYAEAQNLYEQSVALYRDINDRGGLARSLDGLGSALCATSDYATARQHLGKALEIATEIQFVPLIFTILTNIGNLLVQTDNHRSGLALLTQVSHHPSSTTANQDRAHQLLAHYRPIVAKAIYESVTAQKHIEEINTLAALAQLEVAMPEGEPSSTATNPLAKNTPPTQPLVEPLTARELEILSLIVDGLSNQQIATTLFITRGTVKWYTSQIYSKLGIVSRTQAIGRARELSIIP